MTAGVEQRVRARLQQARFEQGLSIRALARTCGLAASTVSRLETGARRLSLAHTEKVANAMNITVDGLFAPDQARRPTDRFPPSRDGKLWQPIGPERPTGARVYHVHIPADLHEPSLHSHEGHQWLYVLDGTVRLVIEHHDLRIDAGRAAAFHTWRPHWLGALDRPADALIIFTPDGRPLNPISPDERSSTTRGS
jgi:transcriptional regulator with XRE-family HTH domain